ncbi:MAG TPA: hypothetical protein VFM18_13845 [Methanosarcina sp.]|nr:hypothetical protein [Methanosarcina sp.]
MANTQAMCTSFKKELLLGHHNFGVGVVRAATTADTFMASLRLATDSTGAGTTAYSATGEVSGTNYTAGGVTISGWSAPATSGTSAYTTPTASFTWTGVTLSSSFDCVLIYNSTQSNKAVSSHTFGAQTVTAGNFSITMPVNAAGTALLQIN